MEGRPPRVFCVRKCCGWSSATELFACYHISLRWSKFTMLLHHSLTVREIRSAATAANLVSIQLVFAVWYNRNSRSLLFLHRLYHQSLPNNSVPHPPITPLQPPLPFPRLLVLHLSLSLWLSSSRLSTAFFRHGNRVADDQRLAGWPIIAAACQSLIVPIADFCVWKTLWIIRFISSFNIAFDRPTDRAAASWLR